MEEHGEGTGQAVGGSQLLVLREEGGQTLLVHEQADNRPDRRGRWGSGSAWSRKGATKPRTVVALPR